MLPEWARKVLGNQPDAQLRAIAEREDARREVENTRWYRLINERLERELEWTQQELRNVSIFHFERLQAYASSIEFVLAFIRGTEKTGKAASELLSERMKASKPKSVDEFMEKIMGAHD